jgi:formate dehydrogenase assembly factor FdhD
VNRIDWQDGIERDGGKTQQQRTSREQEQTSKHTTMRVRAREAKREKRSLENRSGCEVESKEMEERHNNELEQTSKHTTMRVRDLIETIDKVRGESKSRQANKPTQQQRECESIARE